MYGIATGISTEGMPISFEVVLQKEGEDALPYIDAYLQLERNNIRLPNRLIKKPSDDLKSRFSTSGEVVKLRGTYRMWNFLWRGNGLMQSKLIIHDDLRTEIETIYSIDEEGANKQHCVMSLSYINHSRKLCLASHTQPHKGREVINFAIIEINNVPKFGKPLLGVFCGQGNDESLAAEPIVLMKEENEFDVKVLEIEEMQKLLTPNSNPYFKMAEVLFNAYGVNSNSKGSREKFLNRIQNTFNQIIQ